MPEFQLYLPWIITAAIVLLALVLLFLSMSFVQRRVRGRKGSRLAVTEYYEIDKFRRLVLVRRDDTEHLLMIGGDQDLVIETGIGEAVDSVLSDVRRSRAPRESVEERPPVPELTRPAPPPYTSQEPLRSPVLRSARPAPRPAVFGDRRVRSAKGAEFAEPRLTSDEPEAVREEWDRDEPDQSSR